MSYHETKQECNVWWHKPVLISVCILVVAWILFLFAMAVIGICKLVY